LAEEELPESDFDDFPDSDVDELESEDFDSDFDEFESPELESDFSLVAVLEELRLSVL
jgi:hypothetical protein